MKNNYLFVLVAALLTSCISTQKYTSFVEPKFQHNKAEIKTKNIFFDVNNLDNLKNKVVSTKLKSQFIPAILFWQWENTIKCEISPVILGQEVQKDFMYYADSLKMEEKLKNKKLEINIEKIPNTFVYTNKGNAVILLIAYTTSSLVAILPEEQSMVVSYKLTENSSIVKQGQISIKNKNESLKNIWKSAKKFTWLYVEKFKQNSKNMTKELAEKLSKEI
jgi:hypothetical protein